MMGLVVAFVLCLCYASRNVRYIVYGTVFAITALIVIVFTDKNIQRINERYDSYLTKLIKDNNIAKCIKIAMFNDNVIRVVAIICCAIIVVGMIWYALHGKQLFLRPPGLSMPSPGVFKISPPVLFISDLSNKILFTICAIFSVVGLLASLIWVLIKLIDCIYHKTLFSGLVIMVVMIIIASPGLICVLVFKIITPIIRSITYMILCLRELAHSCLCFVLLSLVRSGEEKEICYGLKITWFDVARIFITIILCIGTTIMGLRTVK